MRILAVVFLSLLYAGSAMAAGSKNDLNDFGKLSVDLQKAILATGLKVVPGRECVAFVYLPKKWGNVFNTSVDGHSLNSSFSIVSIRQATLWNKYHIRSLSTLLFLYTSENMYGEANRWNYNRGEVDADKAYSIWIDDKRTYPSNPTGLNQTLIRKAYPKEFELLFYFRNFTLTQLDDSSYSTMRESCLGDREGTMQDCFCVGTSRE